MDAHERRSLGLCRTVLEYLDHLDENDVTVDSEFKRDLYRVGAKAEIETGQSFVPANELRARSDGGRGLRVPTIDELHESTGQSKEQLRRDIEAASLLIEWTDDDGYGPGGGDE